MDREDGRARERVGVRGGSSDGRTWNGRTGRDERAFSAQVGEITTNRTNELTHGRADIRGKRARWRTEVSASERSGERMDGWTDGRTHGRAGVRASRRTTMRAGGRSGWRTGEWAGVLAGWRAGRMAGWCFSDESDNPSAGILKH